MHEQRPGSDGEHALQERYGTFKRAAAFYDKQMLDHLNPLMQEYLARQEMMFVSTADANGECDSSFRAGPPGFVRILDERTIMYPEYRGNGVMASMGNISENPHVGLLFVDFFHSGVGMHVNGRARVIEHTAVEAFAPLVERLGGSLGELADTLAEKTKIPERWVMVEIIEAYIHCSKHIPILAHLPGNAGLAPPSGDHFKAKDDERPWRPQNGSVEADLVDAEIVAAEVENAELVAAEVESAELVAAEAADAEVVAAEAADAEVETEVPSVAGVEAFLDEDDADVVVTAGALAAGGSELDSLIPPAWVS
jgi:predicted pyridoxine 5'-phosphate oxidase superfamily flavin-nucleotide-binding protein